MLPAKGPKLGSLMQEAYAEGNVLQTRRFICFAMVFFLPFVSYKSLSTPLLRVAAP